MSLNLNIFTFSEWEACTHHSIHDDYDDDVSAFAFAQKLTESQLLLKTK